MEEERYSINWLSLFIKVTVFVVVVLLAIWLISKIVLKNKGLSFDENNKKFQDAVVEYFSKNLPKEDESKTVTLNQLITWDYLDKLKDEDGKTCNIEKSKAKIDSVEDYYSIKSELVCGSKSETNYIKLGNEKCSECDIKIEGLKVNSKKDSEENKKDDNEQLSTALEDTTKPPSITSGNNNSQNQITNGNTNNQTILYEYVKEVNEYSDWYVGKVTGNNIENSTRKISYSNFCKNEEKTYYTMGYTSTTKNYIYQLELKNVKTSDEFNIINTSYFEDIVDYQNYIDNKNRELSMVGSPDNSTINASARTFMNSSLTSKNFTYKVSSPYKSNGKYYVNVTINVKTFYGVTPYYYSSIRKNIYFVPVKFTGSYVDTNNCITDKTENYSKYSGYTITKTWNETVDIYRYKITIVDYKYSNATSLEGYTKTGNTKIAG